MDLINEYFPSLNKEKKEKLLALHDIYIDWNQKINVISRKDIDAFYERHVLHSLSISKFHQFNKNDIVLDLGAGGGFPGIPLAINYPNVKFLQLDSIQKKTKVMQAVVDKLMLSNVEVINKRAEDFFEGYNKVICRAVAKLSQLNEWIQNSRKKAGHTGELEYLFLKGGNLNDEINEFKKSNHKKLLHFEQISLDNHFKEDFFSQKHLLYIKING